MRTLCLSLLTLFALSNAAHAQIPRAVENAAFVVPHGPGQARTIEGFWQDIAGRTLFKRDATPEDVMGAWYTRDVGLPYFDAKLIQKSGATYELLDLRYSADYVVKVLGTTEDSIEFVRTTTWSGCRMHHKCRLDGAELFC